MQTWAGVVVAMGLAFSVGCLGGGSSAKQCDAHLTYKGQEFDASGDNEQFAKESACIGYCASADETVGKAYDTWKATPDGQKSKMSRFAEVDLNQELRGLRDACAKTCAADIESGTAKVKVTCP